MAAVLGTTPTLMVADGHDQQRGDQGLLAAQPIAEVAEGDARRSAGTRNALANVPIEAIVANVELRCGKNTVGNTSAAAVP